LQYVAWLGANDIQSEGNFVWESSGAPLTFFNWAINEPNNAAGDEGCMHFYGNGLWNDYNCQTRLLLAMCEVLYTCA